MLKEIVDKLITKLAPLPSKEFTDYISEILAGHGPIPVYGLGHLGIFQFYGRNKKGYERGRLIIPWGESEKSYLIKGKAPDFTPISEGFFHRSTE